MARFVPNRHAERDVLRELGDSEGRRFLTRAAEDIAENAKAIAPEGTGTYRDSIGVVPAEMVDGEPVAYVTSSDFAAHWVEFGSVNNPPYRVFTNAADMAGAKFEDRG